MRIITIACTLSYATANPSISVYGSWQSAGLSPAFPQACALFAHARIVPDATIFANNL